jgi:hypothetical protein
MCSALLRPPSCFTSADRSLRGCALLSLLTGFKHDSLSRPLAVRMKTSLTGVGKDRDEAFPCEYRERRERSALGRSLTLVRLCSLVFQSGTSKLSLGITHGLEF